LNSSFSFVGRVVIIALTPGTPETAAPAVSKIKTGDDVITLWYMDKMFVDHSNMSKYEQIKRFIVEHS
jgi:hypothetical protein